MQHMTHVSPKSTHRAIHVRSVLYAFQNRTNIRLHGLCFGERLEIKPNVSPCPSFTFAACYPTFFQRDWHCSSKPDSDAACHFRIFHHLITRTSIFPFGAVFLRGHIHPQVGHAAMRLLLNFNPRYLHVRRLLRCLDTTDQKRSARTFI